MQPAREWTYRLAEIDRVASELAEQLTSHRVVALSGELGAGKTTLVQALCRAWGVTAAVTSPTFALEHVYASPAGPIHHFDAYRLARPDEALAIGAPDTWASGERCLIEWPERVADWLPPETAHLVIDRELETADSAPSESGDRRRLRLFSTYV